VENNVTGRYLIARPHLQGVFARSVIYMYEDLPTGSGGVIINRQTGKFLADILAGHNIAYPGKIDPIYLGGPVATNSLMMIHSDDFSSTNTLFTPGGINISSDDLMIEKIVNGARPRAFKMCAGRSQWAPGQLHHELKSNSWLVADLPKKLTFDFGNEKTWERSIEFASNQMFRQYF
jgi:putative transcriptional regulator